MSHRVHIGLVASEDQWEGDEKGRTGEALYATGPFPVIQAVLHIVGDIPGHSLILSLSLTVVLDC